MNNPKKTERNAQLSIYQTRNSLPMVRLELATPGLQ